MSKKNKSKKNKKSQKWNKGDIDAPAKHKKTKEELQKPQPTFIDLIAWGIWDKLVSNNLPDSPGEIKEWLEHHIFKSPLQQQIYFETDYKDFAKEYASVYSEVNKEVKDAS